MIKSFSTPKFSAVPPVTPPAGGSGSGLLKPLLIIALVGAGAYLGYKYIYLPYMEKKKENQ